MNAIIIVLWLLQIVCLIAHFVYSQELETSWKTAHLQNVQDRLSRLNRMRVVSYLAFFGCFFSYLLVGKISHQPDCSLIWFALIMLMPTLILIRLFIHNMRERKYEDEKWQKLYSNRAWVD